MKNIKFTIILILFLITNSTNSQSYFPLFNNSSWNIKVVDFGSDINYSINQDNEIQIGAFLYKKFFDSYSNEIIFAREDISNKKVYKLINNVDVLFLDFNLQVGETIVLASGDTYSVSSITQINVFGGARKSFYLTNLTNQFNVNDEIWIEGVGNINHPLKARFEYAADPYYILKCSFQGQDPIYNQGLSFNGIPVDCPRLGINNFERDAKFSFTPNPFVDELVILCPFELENATIKIFNSIGQLVKVKERLFGQKIVFQRENLKSGIYMAQLFQNDELFSKNKILIRD